MDSVLLKIMQIVFEHVLPNVRQINDPAIKTGMFPHIILFPVVW